ncbi:hypothetical protein L6164_033363 [Bauhinia variegata]|uniref:Uncharacterized protein n=1 Tax=Bauhinia variegata TaxID=167791 RepID=A0ACB9KRV9_BAUVA|nr:hypothetical protein L6164_033363 [Bauhinia variegata]
MDILQLIKSESCANTVAMGVFYLALFVFILKKLSAFLKHSQLPQVPVVPGLPVIGNLLQLKEKKPYKTFKQWADKYGPIYSIRAGASSLIVLNSAEVAKEAMVTRFSSISTRKLSNPLQHLTSNKCMVATSDYNDFHKMIKKHILTNLLGANAQKRHRHIRKIMVDNLCSNFRDRMKTSTKQVLNFRAVFESELFGLSMKQSIGNDIESIYVEDLGRTLSRQEVFKTLVHDMLEGAIEVDWRDFFPYLKWIPNKSVDARIQRLCFKRNAVMKALIIAAKKRMASGNKVNCYIDYLLSEAKELTKEQIMTLLWEVIIETSDTTLVTTEWAIYELAKDKIRQERLHEDIKNVCGREKMTEDQIPKLPYLGAVFHETLRKYSPAPVVPLRYVHEDTQLGGYHIPAGTQIAINLYGCNMDEKRWENPYQWMPERFLDVKYDPMDLYKTMAFGAGKRVCAGSLQAMFIACSSIGRLVQEFEWELNDGEEDNVDTKGLTTHKLHPLQLKLKPRN